MPGFKKFAKNTLKFTGKAVEFGARKTAQGVAWTGRTIWNHREEIAGGVAGAAKGAFHLGQDAYGLSFGEKDFSRRIEKIKEQSAEYKNLYEKLGSRQPQRELLIESLGIGASFINGYAFLDYIPEEVKEAYKAAYPLRTESLEEAAGSMSDEQLAGLVSGIKGKLFEMRYADYLNDGNLPDGYEAVLASSANNPGWDIAILDADGAVQQELQLKATESIDYVRDAIEKYPDIDIVTTEEAYSHLAMHGMADNVIDSGISNEELTSVVAEALGDKSLEISLAPPIIPLLLIGYSVYKKESLKPFEKGTEAGERYIKSYLSYLAGGAVAVATNTWWLGLLASVGTRFLSGRGRANYDRISALDDLIRSNEEVLSRMRSKACA